MTFSEFHKSLSNEGPPATLGAALRGLWWDAKGDWARAHESAQADDSPAGAWVHAHLHRKEGDISNADYWYARAGKVRPQTPLEQEWTEISQALLGNAK